MSEDLSWVIKSDFVQTKINEGKRIDGRAFDEYRKIEITPDYIPNAPGSSLVKLGKTQVIAGVTLNVGTPYGDSPESGVLMTGAEFSPVASPDWEAGPPSVESIELARVVDRGIRESQAINFDKLCITPKEAVWMVMVDLQVIDYDGNLFDAATLAATSALLNTKLQKYEEERVIREKTKTSLPVNKKPVENTFAKINKSIVLDPILGEEKAMDARITFANVEDGLCAIQKGGNGSFTRKEIDDCFELATKKSKELRKLL